jgi:putative membrane protein
MFDLALIPLADFHDTGWWIVFPLGWFLLFLLVFTVFRRYRWGGPGCGWGYYAGYDRRPTVDAGAVLDRRFAEGEIDAEEYRARREELRRR